MTTIYQVIKAEYIDWEVDSRDVVCVSLDKEEAIERATEVAENFFMSRYESNTDMFFANFERFTDLKDNIPTLFNTRNSDNWRYNRDSKDVYVVAVEAGQIVNLWSDEDEVETVWRMTEDFAYNLFSTHLDRIMVRDHLDCLPVEEKEILWAKFRRNKKILSNSSMTAEKLRKLGIKNRRMTVQDKLITTLSGAEIWAMTAANDEDMEIYNTYEA